jgi:hypothetical protein
MDGEYGLLKSIPPRILIKDNHFCGLILINNLKRFNERIHHPNIAPAS